MSLCASSPAARSAARLLVLAAATAIGAAPGLGAADAGYTTPPPAAQMPILGIEMTPVPEPVQEQQNLSPNQGVYVQGVYPNTAAAAMNLQQGDVILTINGAPISSMTDLRNEVSVNQVGDPVEVSVSRNGQAITTTGQFQAWPASIPYEPIDPALEQSYRNYQENRLQQNRSDIDQAAQQVADMAQQLQQVAAAPDTNGFANLLLPQDLAARDWTSGWHLHLAIAHPDAGPAAAPATATALPSADQGQQPLLAWHLRLAIQSHAASPAQDPL